MKAFIFANGGRLHRIAYDWDPEYRGEKRPKKTSICKLFWLSLFALVIGWPILFAATRVLGWVVRIVGAVPMFILFGRRPAGWKWRFLERFGARGTEPWDALPFVDVERWPEIRGMRVLPGIILMVAFIVFGITVMVAEIIYNGVYRWFLMDTVIGTQWGRYVFGSITIAITILVLRAKARNSEEYQMVTGFVKAKVERFCPTVEFR